MIRLDFDGLTALLDTLADVRRQGASCLGYTRTEVCRPDGFETSAVCLLRPLGEALRGLSEEIAEAERVVDDWFAEVDLDVRRAGLRFAHTDADQTQALALGAPR
jgi:hypothetical protein